MLWHIWGPLAWRRTVWFFWGLILLALVLSQGTSEVRAKDQPGITPQGDEKGRSSGLQRPTTGLAGAGTPLAGGGGQEAGAPLSGGGEAGGGTQAPSGHADYIDTHADEIRLWR